MRFPVAGHSWLHWADHFSSVVPFCEWRLRFCSFLPWLALYVPEFLAALCWGSSAAVRLHSLPAGGCRFPGENGGFQENWRERRKGCGGLCPEQQRPDKQRRRSWQSWEVTSWSTLRTLMDYPVYFPPVPQRLYRKLWAERCTVCRDSPFFPFLAARTKQQRVCSRESCEKFRLLIKANCCPLRCRCWLEFHTAQSCRQHVLCKKTQGQTLLLWVGRWLQKAEDFEGLAV